MDKYSDRDFFTDKFQHIHLKDEISDESVNKLIKDIREANATKSVDDIFVAPKPIVIHINSPGGDVSAGKRMMTIFAQSRVPIYTLVCGESASAATFLSILSKNRLMTRESLCLIHQYFMVAFGKREDILFNIKDIEKTWSDIKEMYLKRTKISEREMDELLRHDLWLNADECLKKGIVDRVIDIPNNSREIQKRYAKRNPQYNLAPLTLIRKSNMNTYYTACPPEIDRLDEVINSGEDAKPLLMYTTTSYCKLLHNEMMPMVSRIKAMMIPTYAIIESDISLDMLLPYLFCSRVYIFEHVNIYCNMLRHNNGGILVSDIIKNANTTMNIYKRILKENTRMPEKMIESIDKEIIILSAVDAVRHGIAHSVLSLDEGKEMSKKIKSVKRGKGKFVKSKEDENPRRK